MQKNIKRIKKTSFSEISSGNSKYKTYQSDVIETIKNLYNSGQKFIDLFNDYTKIRSEAMYKTKHGTRLKILTSKHMLQRLPIALTQVKACNNSDKLLILRINQKKLRKKYIIG